MQSVWQPLREWMLYLGLRRTVVVVVVVVAAVVAVVVEVAEVEAGLEVVIEFVGGS